MIGFYESTSKTQRFSRGPVARARSEYFADLDCVVAPGTGPAQALLHAGVTQDRIRQGFNPVDVDKFRRTTTTFRAPSAAHNFIYVGQLIERKNVINLVQAFGSATFRDDNLTIVGKGHLEQALLAEVARLGVADRVRLIGSVPNDRLPSVMWEHDTLVLPSIEEVWGLVVNEALAAGLHAVVSTRAGILEDISHMGGVIPTDVTVEQIAKSMAKSKTQWRGPVPEPEILRHTPEALADLIVDAVRSTA
ncbi:glycosyltransferase [Nocardioides zeae]|uniref:Glycosyltransferase family 4 protein n=1 Tax=Nocardioides zeae TaxID=1457234 RepID=A0A6P0HMR2_9ACTN|nr:glycosyltransferase [Nocardioides zeae]NEN79968.1 glycosyltransferase family 4 protein [Nocardioides zeae]